VQRIALTLILIVLLAVPAVPAAAQSASTTPGAQSGAPTSYEARLGGRSGFGRSAFGRRSRPTFGRARPSVRRPAARRSIRRRPLFRHGFFGSVLRALGIAYLVNLLFGWGPGGGSPFGLLIVLGLIFWLATRRRRRPPLYY